MTIGIYALYWVKQDLIYIGQSVNIERRFNYHKLEALKQKHTNYKVQNAFNNFGQPEFIIIESCNSESLNSKEILYTKEFDSINKGLNIVEAGTSGFGPNCSSATYSKLKILKIFSLLYKTTLTYTVIAEKLHVTKEVVNSISQEVTHNWLKETYPVQYSFMQENRNKRKLSNKSGNIAERKGYIPHFVSPEGLSYKTDNLSKFCKEHPTFKDNYLAAVKGLSRLVNKISLTYKGWKLVEQNL